MVEKRKVKRTIKFAQFIPNVGRLVRKKLSAGEVLEIELIVSRIVKNIQLEMTFEIEEEVEE